MESAHDQLHQQLAEANEDDNAAVSAVLQGDRLSTSALQMGEHAYHAHKLRPYKQAANAAFYREISGTGYAAFDPSYS